MPIDGSPLIEYTKHYPSISFDVRYSYRKTKLGMLYFAAQPLESKDEACYDYDFLYGQINGQMQLQIGFKDFLFPMTKDFHHRLDMLYDALMEEYVNFIHSQL
ncbi:hypothetical protein Q4603_14860 [Zobellia galactanivorans]|uniref:Uncharacterized protein n=2 Tax=Zobellia TaxID=112040 RepID=G0L928_ZOBGA|nr:hypothetical protein [Zobellia galactanivorans]MBU3028459.1 hypothetical protein [Zobellia galactanivorans]MDO6809904.1 hypothetical protein [Zobellia galactanivorans]CAZ94316.1 Hypothetical protein ZOBELLIA_243 [Zobellia galactanivorans]